MEKQGYIDFWVQQSERDLEIADALYASGKFDATLFFGHLSLEKLLKAIWIRDNAANIPPKTHNLVFLIDQTTLKPDEEMTKLLRKVNEFNIETRYPDYKLSFYHLCTGEFADEHLTLIKETYSWLLAQLKTS